MTAGFLCGDHLAQHRAAPVHKRLRKQNREEIDKRLRTLEDNVTYRHPYLSVHQSRSQPPTEWQQELANAIEGVFSKGARELEEVVVGLNESRVHPLKGGTWTAENFTALMRELGV
jgi:hypothetical protein